jgi:hypothetical protein
MLVFGMIYVAALLHDALEIVPVTPVLTAIGGLAGLYFTGQVADKRFLGIHYRKELDENNPNRFS